MLGLGSSLYKAGKIGKSIVRDGLVLRHDYNAGAVQPLSDGAASFVRSNTDSISLGVGTALTPMATGFSACFWAKTKDASIDQMVLAGDNGTHQRMYIGIEDGHYAFGIGDSVWGAETTAATTEWTHVALTYTTGDVAQLYLNGVKDRVDNDNDASAFTDGTFGSDFYIGQQGTGTGFAFDGYICNVGIWSAALTQPQIKSIMHKDYAALSASEKTSLVSWWNLDSVIPDTTTFVYDNHHGDAETLGSELVGSAFYTAASWTGGGDISEFTTTSVNYLRDTTIPGETGNGDYIYLKASGDRLTTNLTVGKTYKVEADFTTDDANAVMAIKNSDNAYTYSSTGDGAKVMYFVATHITNDRLMFSDISADKFAKMANVSIKPVNGNTGTLS